MDDYFVTIYNGDTRTINKHNIDEIIRVQERLLKDNVKHTIHKAQLITDNS
jgi:hypothetical protein